MEMELRPSEFGSMSEDQPKDVGFDNPLYDIDHQVLTNNIAVLNNIQGLILQVQKFVAWS